MIASAGLRMGLLNLRFPTAGCGVAQVKPQRGSLFLQPLTRAPRTEAFAALLLCEAPALRAGDHG